MTNTEYSLDATWTVVEDEDTGEVYWSGGGVGDMDRTDFAPGEALIVDPTHFPVGYHITGEAPMKASAPDKNEGATHEEVHPAG